MKFDEYQKQAATTDVMSGSMTSANDPSFVAKVLGLAGETGEVAEKFKKIIRDKQGVISPEDKQEIAKELGDVLWYLAMIAKYMDLSLDDIANQNLEKLFSRKARGASRGSGDNR